MRGVFPSKMVLFHRHVMLVYQRVYMAVFTQLSLMHPIDICVLISPLFVTCCFAKFQSWFLNNYVQKYRFLFLSQFVAICAFSVWQSNVARESTVYS